MKIKEEFLLREVAGSNIVVPLGEAEMNFGGMMTLNDVGAFIWHALETDTTEEAVLEALLSEYAIDRETAQKDVHTYIARLREKGIIED